MELKDMILSTLAELEDIKEEEKKEEAIKSKVIEPLIKEEKINEKIVEPLIKEEKPEIEPSVEFEEEIFCGSPLEEEKHFCESMRERILVLFEGFQSPTNKNIEAKVDLTLNFLEYLLAVIDERLENLDKK